MISPHRLSSKTSLRRVFLSTGASILWAVSISANVSSVLFQSNMVLQREMTVPVFGMASSGENITVTFRGQSKSTEAGSDNKWYWAKGVIREDTVILTSDQVNTPVKVRYAWADYPIATPLYNGAGLPPVPFQSDIPREGTMAIYRRPEPAIGSGRDITSVTTMPHFDALGRLRPPRAPGSITARNRVVQYK